MGALRSTSGTSLILRWRVPQPTTAVSRPSRENAARNFPAPGSSWSTCTSSPGCGSPSSSMLTSYWSDQTYGAELWGFASPGAASMFDGAGPVLGADVAAVLRVVPSRDVARGPDARDVRGQRRVAEHAVIERHARTFEPPGVRRHADTDDDHVGGHRRAVGQRHRLDL